MTIELTQEQRDELQALAHANAALKGPLFVHRGHWRGLYEPLVRRGLVSWKQHPILGPKLRATEITDAGRAALASQN